ncbi:MAG: carbohydrate-binding domain-containing protein, partial [Eggerthellaceae bacterium]|nr:carbohydrate-binding domain-containing protein [Eggerthellaceae bacterium]
MKHVKMTTFIAPAALTVALAAGMVGCAAHTDNAASSSLDQMSASAAESASAAANDVSAGSSASGEAASSATQAQASASSAQAAQKNQGGMGGMNAMDTQPGQTTDKGFTANDNGLAITATLNAADAFTERDLQQEADTSSATSMSLADGKDITITEEGVYVISGSASEATIVVEAPDTAKVQIVLDNVSITNADFPAIYVKSADKVFVTLSGDSKLAVTGTFVADGETNTDAAIFSKDDLCLNGSGSLTIDSTEHAIVSKDDLKVTGGTYTLTAAAGSGLRANDSVRIAGGTFTISAEDGIKAENDDDNELGYVYISDGTFTIDTTDNCIQGYAFVWVDGGTFDLKGAECIEGTYIQINDGTLRIDASDDAINASIKSS